MAALAVVPISSALPLYRIEEELAALADTAGCVPPEQEAEFAAEVERWLAARGDKVDRIGHLLTHLEAQAALASAELKRLQERKKFYERSQEKLESYVIGAIRNQGADAKGKYRPLEGSTVSFSIRKNPASVEVFDPLAVPLDYQTITLTLPAKLLDQVLDSLDMDLGAQVLEHSKDSDVTVNKTAVKAALNAKVDVPGARFADPPKYGLVRK
jgi:hypothetical protein